MRYLLTIVALALWGCGQNIASEEATTSVNSTGAPRVQSPMKASSATSATSSVNATNSTSVTSSTTARSGSTASSTTNDTSTSCSVTHNGKRCKVSCRSPQTAQCGKNDLAAAPSCICD